MKSEILFYIGSGLIVSIFIFILVGKFKDEYVIDLKENKWLIVFYIIFLIGALIAWRKLYLTILANTSGISKYNEIIERLING
jgi:hypothetical protein